MHNEILPMDDKGCIRADIVEQLEWKPAPIWAGQALWFHSRTPHRSGPNTSTQPRRAIYPTYNALREGDLREAYYEQKAKEFAADDGNRVSLIGDFEGHIL
jgi:ectoine hydroxylase-related dioxygenase (phytanoyl-CoA dioxygenase family)